MIQKSHNISEEMKSLLKRHLHSHAHCSIIQTAKLRTQLKYPSVDDYIEKVWCIYTVKYYSVSKERKPAICDNMEEPGRHYVK
jgi:hypothetical protein